MTNYRLVVTELRELLKSGDLTALGDEQKKLIDDYAEHVRLANRRLAECEAFLQKDLISEAVHAAKADPDLLDYARTLEIPERDMLEMLCVQKKWPPPPVLSIATAEAVNRAYESLESLDELLERHRLLALARAPLVERRNVLLNIIDRDPETQVWKTDQANWEHELVKQLDAYLSRPDALNDPDRVLNEIRVLNDERWRIDVPKDLIRKVEGKKRKAEDAIARRELTALVDPILRAYQGKEEAEVRRLLKAWQTKADAGHIGPNDEIANPVRDVFDWLARRDRRREQDARIQAAREKLVNVLNSDANVIQLRAAWATYVDVFPGTDHKPEAALETRYRELLDRREQLSKQRYRLIFISAGAAVMLLAILAVFLIVHLRHGALVAEKADGLRMLLDNNRMKGYLAPEEQEKLDAAVADVVKHGLGAEQEIVPLVNAVRKQQEDEHVRRKNYAAALSAAASTAMTLPAAVGYSEVLRWAKAPDEVAEATTAQKDHDARHQRWKQEKKTEATDLIKKAKDALAKVDEKIQAEAGLEAEGLLRTIQNDLLRLSQFESLQEWEQLRKHDENLWLSLRIPDEVRVLRSQVLLKVNQVEHLARADTAISTVDNAFQQHQQRVIKYGELLKEYVRQYDTTQRARRLKPVLADLKAEEALERWGEIVASWKGNLLKFEPGQAEAALRNIPDPELLPSPFREQARQAKDLLARHAKCRFEEQSAPPFRFNLNFEPPAIKSSYLVKRIVEGKKEHASYYLTEKEFNEKKKDFRAPNYHHAITYYNEFDKTETVTLNYENFEAYGLSPSARLARSWHGDIKPSLQGVEPTWRFGVLRMLLAIETQEDLDPIHRIVLLEKCLSLIRDTSLLGAELTTKQRDYLASAKNKPTGSMLWIDPRQNLEDKRNWSRTLFKNYPLSNAKELNEQGRQAEAKLLAEYRQYPVPVGWLDQSEGRIWVLRGTGTRWDGAAVYVIAPGQNTAERQWLHLGAIKDGRLHLTTNRSELLRQGLPCFVTVRSSDL